MDYLVVDSTEFVYPDIKRYLSGRKEYSGIALRDSFACFRVAVWNCGDKLTVNTSCKTAEIYEEIAVPVESNPGFDSGFLPHHPERIAPFSVYDCEKPYSGEIECKNEVTSIFFRFPTGEDINEEIVIDGLETIRIPVKVKVTGKPVSENLQFLNGYSIRDVSRAHKIDFRDKKLREIDEKYLKMLRSMHQNRAYIDWPHIRKTPDGDWEFNFDFFNRRAKQLFELGFEALHIYGVGFRKAWDRPEIITYGMDALTYEAYDFLSKYLCALRENLREQGWLEGDRFTIGIADEPNHFNATPYRALSGLVRKFLPELKIYDAVSFVPVYGAVDIWVPRTDEFEKSRENFERFRQDGDEIWHYVCLYPREDGYINRFMDTPLLTTRYLFWGNYKYSLTGYLHWSVNNYQGDIDPFKGSCPDHVNAGSHSILPPGDDKLIYPGDDEPWFSARFDAQRESAEDYEMLLALSKDNKALADEICDEVFHSFHDVDYDPVKFRTVRERLIEEYSKM